MQINIVIVDNHPVIQAGLGQLLDKAPGMHVVGFATCSSSGCALIEDKNPDVVIFDTVLADASGPEVIRRFRSRFPDLPAVLFTEQSDRETVVEALKQRIQGFVVKTSPVERLVQAVRAAGAGRPYLDPEISSALVAGFADRVEPQQGIVLSARQLAVLRLLADGLSNKEIARDLYITESTVKFHVSAILQHLEARNRAHAVRIAETQGWIQRDGNHGYPAGKLQFVN